jgi:hypothetical protein
VSPGDPNAINPINGIDDTVTVTNGGSTPNIVDVNLSVPATDSWMIYNPDDDSVPEPFYRVRFIGKGGWTGKGKTGSVVGGNIYERKTNRVDW